MSARLKRRLSDARKFFLSVRLFKAPLVPSVWRFLWLLLHDKFSPNEIFMLGLLDPKKWPNVLARYFPHERLWQLQHRLNPADSRHLTDNKITFDAHCVAGGLPTPRILTVFSKLPNTSDDGIQRLETDSDWHQFVEDFRGVSLVIKPVGGAHGEGVLVLNASRDGYIAADGKLYGEHDTLRHMRCSRFSTWIVQERLIGHRDLKCLADTEYIQTARLVSYIDSNKKTTIIGARFRIIGGCSGTDNFDFGLSGNLIASVEKESGCIRNVVAMRSDLLGLVPVTHHPRTGVELVGFKIPLWQEAVQLVDRAARHFFPLRTIGWDVAITDKGVFLIEGNEIWNSGFYELDFTNEYELLRECALNDRNSAMRLAQV